MSEPATTLAPPAPQTWGEMEPRLERSGQTNGGAPAAEVLLANYRSNPKGERAADSLFYLGQSLMKLDQASQACKAYAELEAVYGSSMRADLKKMLPDAKSQAKCS